MWPALLREGCAYMGRWFRPARAAERKRRLAQEGALAEDWCASCAVPVHGLVDLLPFELILRDPKVDHPAIFEAAKCRVEACPEKLGGAGNLSLLYSLAKALHARWVVETGVAYGWSSLALLLAIRGERGARLLSVDLPYLTMRNDDWVGVAVPPDLRAPWRLLRMADREGLPKAIQLVGTIDLAHYDSDKSPEGRLFGYNQIWRALRPGGVLVSDDVSDNLAFRDFSRRVERAPIVLKQDRKYQGILIK
jgi:predicted O-methyltransferase YrrM